jgi:hypothetical protein
VLTEISDIKFLNEVLFVRRRNVFLFLTLNWNECYWLRYKGDRLQFTARNCIMLCVCVCMCNLLAAALAVVVAAGPAEGRGGVDVI